MPTVRLADIIDPSLFSARVNQLITSSTTNFFNSPVFQRNPELDAFLAGPGSSLDFHSFNDLGDDADNVSSDDPAVQSTPYKIGQFSETVVRQSRNNSWSSMKLAQQIAHGDPVDAIANRVAAYWVRRHQVAALAQLTGIFAENTTNDAGDLTLDISGVFSAGVTSISLAALIDALTGLGSSASNASVILMHSVPYATLQKLNLIQREIDPETSQAFNTILGRQVIVEDNLPVTGGTYETFIMGPGAIQYGMALPDNATAVDVKESSGNGAGEEVLYSRMHRAVHVAGYSYIGASNPTDAVIADAASYNRVFSERKQIPIVRLVTTEA